MSDTSWFRNSSLSSALFTPIPEGQLFRCAPPWIFGPVREYRLTNAQADQLVKDFARTQMRGVFIVLGTLFALLIVATIAMTLAGVEPNAEAHPFIYGGALLAFALLAMVLIRVVSARAYRASLKDIPFTLASRQRQGLGKSFKAIVAVQALMPKWLHIVLLCVISLSVVQALFQQNPIDIVTYGLLAVSLAVGLFIRLRAPQQPTA